MRELKYECETYLIDKVNEFVAEADVIITTTTSIAPVFNGSMVKKGCLVCGVGSYQPHTRELDSELMRNAKIYVDTRNGCLAEAGDVLIPIKEGLIKAD